MNKKNTKNSKAFVKRQSFNENREMFNKQSTQKDSGLGIDYTIESIDSLYGKILDSELDIPCKKSSMTLLQGKESLILRDSLANYYEIMIGEKFKSDGFKIEKIRFIMNKIFVFLIAKDSVNLNSVYKTVFNLNDSFEYKDNEIVHK